MVRKYKQENNGTDALGKHQQKEYKYIRQISKETGDVKGTSRQGDVTITNVSKSNDKMYKQK